MNEKNQFIPAISKTNLNNPTSNIIANSSFFAGVGDGTTDDSNAFIAFIEAANGLPTILYLESGKDHLISSDVTLPNTVVVTSLGGTIRIAAGATFRIEGAIDAPVGTLIFSDISGNLEIRTSKDDQSSFLSDNQFHLGNSTGAEVDRVSFRQGPMSALWFAGDDIGEKVNNAFKAGSHFSWVTIPSGFFKLSTTIDLNVDTVGSEPHLSGAGMLNTNLQIVAGASIIGIDARRADECVVDNLRVTEGIGARSSVCFALGLTSSQFHNLWAGNSKYGFYAGSRGSAGINIHDCFVEACDYNIFIGTRHGDSTIEGLEPVNATGKTRLLRMTSVRSFNGVQDGITIIAYDTVEMSSGSTAGDWAPDDVMTGETSGATAKVVSAPKIGDVFCVRPLDSVQFTIGETVTNGSTGTGTVTSSTVAKNRFPVQSDITLNGVDSYECAGAGARIEENANVSITGSFFGNDGGGLIFNGNVLAVVGAGTVVDRNIGVGIYSGNTATALGQLSVNGAMIDNSIIIPSVGEETTTGIFADSARTTVTGSQFGIMATGVKLGVNASVGVIGCVFHGDIGNPVGTSQLNAISQVKIIANIGVEDNF